MNILKASTAALLVHTVLFLYTDSLNVVYASDVKKSISEEIDPMSFGASGDGISDDTRYLQKAFTLCSEKGLTCSIPGNKVFLVTSPIFLWGAANLKSDSGGSISFNVHDEPYLLNIGISGVNRLEKPFTGVISGIKFKVQGGKGGRIIYFWRTDGAKVVDNEFDVGQYAYSATSSGNNNKWVKNGFKNTIRKNITISGNKIFATSDHLGSEGIGLGHFDGAIIKNNLITGVGDDPIGVHFCKNVKISHNVLKSVDGRIFVVNSTSVEINDNKHYRVQSLSNNKFYKGISLLYIGYESLGSDNDFSAPSDIFVHNNYLHYPAGSIDAGAAIYIYGPRGVVVDHNIVENDSDKVTATGLHLLPARFTGEWRDPDRKDSRKLGRVWDATISNNVIAGAYPQKLIMTGNCVEYAGNVLVKNNVASGFQIYCNNVISTNNKMHVVN